MDYSERWEIRDELGEGGQGKVYLVSNKLKSLDIERKIVQSINQFSGVSTSEKIKEHYESFRGSIIKMLELEKPSQQGALKVLHLPEDARDPNLAEKRIQNEIEAMSKNIHQNLIKIIEVDEDYKWYVSEYYPNGSLSKNRNLFKGDLYSALKSIRPLVEGVSELHKKGYVHRDIKPQNVFIDSDRQLILGDFGLVYFKDDQRIRASKTFENVGSRDWMPGWAMGIRIDDVKSSFDVFSLGKLLWSMVSGMPILQLWYYDKDHFNVEIMLPDSPHIKFANLLFSKCVVEEEHDCLPDAASMLEQIDSIITMIESNTDRLDLAIERRCRVCGKGIYNMVANENFHDISYFGLRPDGNLTMRIFTCNICGHVQQFSYKKDNRPSAWES